MGTSNLSAQIRAFRWQRQGLDGSLTGAPAARVLEQTGWMRSVGGAGPYLGLFARAGTTRQQADQDGAALRIHELPAARGCTYVVPAADFALALRAGQDFDSDLATAKKFLDVTEKEIGKLAARVVAAVAKPLDPRDLKEAVGDAVRNLGEAGKKRGMATTLPLALGLLQSRGEIRRVPLEGRFDRQRYAYVRWGIKLPDLTEEQLAAELAKRYFRWAAPATPAQFQWWSGLGARAAKAATATLKLVALEGDELMFPDDLDALRSQKPAKAEAVALVGVLDNLFHLRREIESASDPADFKRIPREGKAGATLFDLPSHAIVQAGRLIGLWEFDGQKQELVAALFGKATPAARTAISEMESFVRDQLGDARQFSLDSPESRAERLAALRKI